MRFVRDLIDHYSEPCDAVVFLQTIEHVEDPGPVLRAFQAMATTVYVSTPNVLTLAPEGAEKSGNPWHLHEYRAEEFRALCERRVRRRRAARALPRAQAARARAGAQGRAGTTCTPRSASPSRFYDRFTPAISCADFALRARAARPRAGLRSGAALSAPVYPELPLAARPRWPAWMAPAAMSSRAFGVIIAAGFPLLPVALLTEAGDAVAGIALLVLVLVQDAALVGDAVFFASRRVRPQPWHFGLRATPFWLTVGLAVLGGLLILGFEVGLLELFGIDDAGGRAGLQQDIVGAHRRRARGDRGGAGDGGALLPRVLLPRAAQRGCGWWWAVLIDSLVFASIHVQYIGNPEIFIVIGLFAAVACLVYEKTGSMFAVIAIHATFNTRGQPGQRPGGGDRDRRSRC